MWLALGRSELTISASFSEIDASFKAALNCTCEFVESHLKPAGILEKSGRIKAGSSGSNVVRLRTIGQWSEKDVKSFTWKESTCSLAQEDITK